MMRNGTLAFAMIGHVAAGVTLAACLSACETPEPADTPATIAAPVESVSHPFTLEGNIDFATCDAVGAPVRRAVSFLNIFPLGRASPTCGTAVGLADPTCANRVGLQGTYAALVNGGNNNWSYATPLQRLLFTEPTPPALPAMIGPITYQFANSGAGASPRIYFQNNSRSVVITQPIFEVTSPSDISDPSTVVDDTHVTRDLVNQNMASLRLSFEFEPTRDDGNGGLDLRPGGLGATERIVNVTIAANGTDDAPITHRLSHIFQSSGSATDTGQDPATVSGFLNKSAVFLTDKQIIRTELPLTPNTGPYAITSYTLAATVTFEDNTQVSVTLPPLAGADLDPCNTIEPARVLISKPRTTLNGTILLRPATGFTTSPYVTHYGPILRNIGGAGGFVVTTSSGGTILVAVNAADYPVALPTTPASAQDPYAYTWKGFPPGTYRAESRTHGSAGLSYPAASALSYPGRPAYRYFTSDAPLGEGHRAMFAFPTLGTSTASTAQPDFATTGRFSVVEDAPVAFDIAADMAYLEGDLNLRGCITNQALSSGAAELVGPTPGLFYGFARGLFLAADSNYLVAAIGGTWKESRYRLKLDQPSPSPYNGMIVIEPANPQTYTLTSGQISSTGAVREYATSRLTVNFSTNGVPVRKPRLEIGQDTGTSGLLTELYDPADATSLLGRYFAVSNEFDANPIADPTVSIYAPSSSRPVAVKPSAEVLVNGVWAREYRPPIQVLLTASAGNSCIDLCIAYASDGSSESYTDDGQGPVVASTTAATAPANTTSVMLTGTLSDEVPISKVLVDGTEYPVISVSDGQNPPTFTANFSMPVNVVEGTNTFSVSGKGRCGNVTATALTVVVTVLADLCAPPVFDQCMESATGSVFYVDLLNAANQACQLRCTIAGPDQTLTCDQSAITCAP